MLQSLVSVIRIEKERGSDIASLIDRKEEGNTRGKAANKGAVDQTPEDLAQASQEVQRCKENRQVSVS